ncbi:MAG: CPBP family intramembrane metalloprotease [Deltaproteobacteria bacterium]|nr:CPBP family intramembrane metalloprotease [Deltaproteobacteria bacterium]
MPNEDHHRDSIPWTIREVWLGVGCLGLWLVISLAVWLLLRFSGLNMNAGLFIALAELALLGPVWWLTIRKYKVPWERLGLRGFKWGVVGLGCGLMVLSFIFNVIYGRLLAIFNLRAQVDLVPIFAQLSSPWWLLVAGVAVAPVVEEIFFRGFLFAGLRKYYGWHKAAIFSSALFALIHVQPTAMIPIFILGYIFSYLYYRSNSIWPGILMHVSTNAMGLGAAYMTAKAGVSL